MNNQPIGVIAAYMGNLVTCEPLVDSDGCTWLLCDGAALSRSGPYQPLYEFIGDTFGAGDNSTTFNIPDLRGQFIRVLDMDSSAGRKQSGRDPGFTPDDTATNERIPMTQVQPPLQQSFVGSIQVDAVPHSHPLSGYDSTAYDSEWPTKNLMSNDDPSSLFGWTDPSGNGETRPVNACVNFIMRVTSPTSAPPGAVSNGIPVGSILFCSNLNAPQTQDEYWYPCDGTTPTLDRSSPLFAAIGSYYGEGDGISTFGLPDLRGYFIRAVDDNAGVDPDASMRKAFNPNPSIPVAAIASMQGQAVIDHLHSIQNTWGADKGNDNFTKMNYTDGSPCYSTYQTLQLTRNRSTQQGSDIRPINVALPTSILASTSHQHLPIGTIIPYAGTGGALQSAGDVWNICNGEEITTASTEYGALYNALFPTPQDIIRAPDLRGLFIRGFDPNGIRDTDFTSRTPMFEGAKGGNNLLTLQGSDVGSHQHGLSSQHHSTHDGGASRQGVSDSGGGSGGTTDSVDATTRSSETRPINIYLHYIVRVK